MRTNYPADDLPLPRITDENPGVYLGCYTPGGDLVEGWVIQDNKTGQKTHYLYQVSWSNGHPSATISVADIKKGYRFSDRDFRRGRNMPIRDLKGLPEKHAKDARAFAIRVASHIRDNYIEDIDFLASRITQFAFKLAEEESQRFACVLYRDLEWLIQRETRLGREYFSARRLEGEHSFQEAISELRRKYVRHRESDDIDAQHQSENAVAQDLANYGDE